MYFNTEERRKIDILIGTAKRQFESASKAIVDGNPDQLEGRLADAIQSLSVCLAIVRNVKQESVNSMRDDKGESVNYLTGLSITGKQRIVELKFEKG